MKNIVSFTLIVLLTLMSVSCKNSGKKFNPTQRTSSLSESEREQKLAHMREELDGISVDTMFYSHGVKMSVLPPNIQGNITENIVEKVLMKMLSITTQNGIGGIGSNPCFAMAVSMDESNRSVTGTAPQKMLIEYDVNFYVVNCITSDVYGSSTVKVTGVGNSFAHATQTAVNDIKNSPELQQMLSTSSERIIKWYNDNMSLLQNKVNEAKANNDFSLALALLESVPEQCTACYKWANSVAPNMVNAMLKQRAAESFSDMKSAIAEAGFTYNPDIAAYMKMIPIDSPEYKEAQKMYDKYTKNLNDERLAEIDFDRRKEMEEFAWEKEKTKLEMEATTKHMEINAGVEKAKAYSTGLTGFLGGAALGGMLGSLISRPILMPFRFLHIL